MSLHFELEWLKLCYNGIGCAYVLGSICKIEKALHPAVKNLDKGCAYQYWDASSTATSVAIICIKFTSRQELEVRIQGVPIINKVNAGSIPAIGS